MKVIIYPEPGYLGDQWLKPAPNDWHLPGVELKRQMEESGLEVDIWPCDVDADKDIGLAFDMPRYLCKMPNRTMCVMLEPPVVYPREYERMNGLPFRRILTFARAFVDDVRVFYSPFPVVEYRGGFAPERDGYICAISSGNKDFPSVTINGHTYESLYQARRQAYQSFGKDIDLYGWGWAGDPLVAQVNYCGAVECKVKTLSKYKYAIVFENVKVQGYASEKYWDCIQAGTIPIYRGWEPDYPLQEATESRWAERVITHLKAML